MPEVWRTEIMNRRGAASTAAKGTVRPLLILLGTRVLDAQAAQAARELRELARGPAILGIADVIDPAANAGLPSDLRFLAPPFDLPDVLRAVRSHLRQAGCILPDSALLEA